MICTKNGVAARLEEYGDVRIGDAYVLQGGTLLLRTTPTRLPWETHRSGNIIVHRIEHWFDEHDHYGVLVSLDGEWTWS